MGAEIVIISVIVKMSEINNNVSNDETNEIPQEILDAADEAVGESLPEASKEKYVAAFESFEKWMANHGTKSFDERVFLAYFRELNGQIAPPTLWGKYSMLRTMLQREKNVDISKYEKLKAYIKKVNVGYKPKKANVFAASEVKRFLIEAPDEDYLSVKVRKKKCYNTLLKYYKCYNTLLKYYCYM